MENKHLKEIQKSIEHKIIQMFNYGKFKAIKNIYLYKQYSIFKKYGVIPFKLDVANNQIHEIIFQEIENQLNQQKGYIYVVSDNLNEYWYKVGMTRKSPYVRLQTLNSAGLRNNLVLHNYYYVPDIKLENIIHKELRLCTPFHQKEFFKTAYFVIDNLIRTEISIFNQFLNELNFNSFVETNSNKRIIYQSFNEK